MTTSTETIPVPADQNVRGEKAELLAALAERRWFLTNTLREMSDEQAAARPTASALCLGGLVKHVTAMEAQWVRFIEGGPSAMAGGAGGDEAYESDDAGQEWAAAFAMTAEDTVASVLAGYQEVADRTTTVITALPDLGAAQPLPAAPWFEPGASWSARRVLLHLIGETAQHSGHADIIRESIDGAKSMG